MISFNTKHFKRLCSPLFTVHLSKLCVATQTQNSIKKTYIPRRAILYVPGSDDRKLQKIKHLEADCVVLDCEDGVALTKKDIARENICKFLSENASHFTKKDCSVRFNGIESGMCYTDMETILSASHLPATVHLPKVDTIEHVDWFSDKLEAALGVRASTTKLRLILFIESARSLLNLSQICQRAVDSSDKKPFILDGLVFGSDDYCADVGVIRTPESTELQYARQHLVTVAKAFKIQAIDMVYIDYKDLEGLRRQSSEGAQFGFTGKQVIHPGQLKVVLEAFTPSEEKVHWAKALIDSFQQHQKDGKGAFVFRGSMVDKPLLLQARNLVEFNEAIDR